MDGKMRKTLSVIIPVYNVEKYLRRCVESIASQSSDDMEIILVDDGSTDKSGRLCDVLSRENKICQVIHKENGGVASARNAGMKIATGEYFFFMDSDDGVSDRFMSTLRPELEKRIYDIIEFGCYWERVYNSIKLTQSKSRYELSPAKGIENILKNKTGNFVIFGIYKKALFENIVFPEGKNYEDVATYYRILIRAKRILRVESELYIYNITNANSITKSVSLKNMTDLYEAMNKLCADIKPYCLQHGIDLDYIEYYRRNAYIYIYLKLCTATYECKLKEQLKKYLATHNTYNLFKFRHYDLKRWGYYQVMHLIGKM
jgi:glycosyltransferase involved in cell wall biosynthesis